MERTHLLDTVEAQVERTEERLENQIKDKRSAANLALEALENESEETGRPVEARAVLKAVGEALGINLQASSADVKAFELNAFKKQLPQLAESAVSASARAGLMTAIERRIGASLGLGTTFKGEESWDAIRQQLVEATEKSHKARAERTLTE